MPIRLIDVGDEDLAVRLSEQLYQAGYYCSAVFFPIVARGAAGVRVMLRADLEADRLDHFCDAVESLMASA